MSLKVICPRFHVEKNHELLSWGPWGIPRCLHDIHFRNLQNMFGIPLVRSRQELCPLAIYGRISAPAHCTDERTETCLIYACPTPPTCFIVLPYLPSTELYTCSCTPIQTCSERQNAHCRTALEVPWHALTND